MNVLQQLLSRAISQRDYPENQAQLCLASGIQHQVQVDNYIWHGGLVHNFR